MEKKRKVLLVLGLILLFLLLTVIGLFFYEYLRIAPNDINFTNITSNSVTVSWNTKKPLPSSVVIKEGGVLIPVSLAINKEKFFDTRDVKQAELLAVQETSNNIAEDNDLTVSIDDFQTEVKVVDRGSYYTHHVTVTGLNPETEYSFMVGDSYLFRKISNPEGESIVKTLSIPDEVRSPLPAYGSVKNAKNQDDVSIDELDPITDGIIYFNYLDEFSNERSAVYSSSFNEYGNWYMDVSNAVGDDGKHFISRFGEKITNILVELEIDAGPLGKWKKVVSFDQISPTDLIVINDPLTLSDDENGLLKISSYLTDSLVKGVQADNCSFTQFCGPCGKFDNGVFVQCSCPVSTLEYRGCNGESTTSLEKALNENASGGSGNNNEATNPGEKNCSGGTPDDYTTVPGEGCKKCNGESGKWEKIADQSACEGLDPFEVKPSAGSGGGGGGGGEVVATSGPCANKIEGAGCSIPGHIGTCTSDGVCEPITIEVQDLYEQACENKEELEDCDLPGSANENGICLSGRCAAACPIEAVLLNGVLSGSICSSNQAPCDCSTWPYRDLSSGEICPDTSICTLSNTGQICDPNGTTCEGGECRGTAIVIEQPEVQNETTSINPGDTCSAEDTPCNCPMWSVDLNEGEVCPQVYNCTLTQSNDPSGKVCNPSGATCKNGTCSGPRKNSLLDNYWFENFVLGVKAQTDTEEYIREQNLEILEELTPGRYIFEYEGEKYSFTIDSQRGTFIYIDKNNNNEYDETIDLLVSDLAAIIDIQTISKEFSYDIKTGLNFINLPYLVEDDSSRTAAGLLKFVNEQYENAFYSISRFNSGRWDIVGQNVEIYDNEDFQLIPGEGYLIKSKGDINIKIVGRPINFETEFDNAPISLNEGWNLIGLYGTNVKSYTAKELIEDINKEQFTADNVTKWANDKQMYEGFQLSEGEEYGFDYPLNILESYFVRITEGKGNWQPSLAE